MKRHRLLLALVALVGLLTLPALATLTARIALGFTTNYSQTSGLGTAANNLAVSRLIEFADGTGADQANTIYHASRTLAVDANEVLDLYASGTLEDPLGNALTLEEMKLLYLYNTSADATLLVFGGTTPVGVCSDSSDIVELPPGGKFLWTAPASGGIDITTNKNLKLEHNGTGSSTLTYEIIVLGVD